MSQIESIDPILGYVSLYKSSCAIVQEDDHTGKHGTYYSIVYHHGKGQSN